MANLTLQMIHGMLYGKGIRFGQLSGLGRVIATMAGNHADVVPFPGAQMPDHAMTIAKVPARKYYWDAELFVDVHLAVCRWYTFDSSAVLPDIYNLEVEALGAKMIYSDYAMPTVDVSDPLIKSPADLDKIDPLDATKGRIPFGVKVGQITVQKIPGPFSSGYFCSPWSLICQAMGYPKAVRALKRDRAFAQALFTWAENQVTWPYMVAFSKAGVKSTSGADAWAAFPELTLELVEEWIIPSSKRLSERGEKELGMKITAGGGSSEYCEEDPIKFDKNIMFKCWEAGAKKYSPKMAVAGMGRTQDWDMHWLQEYATQGGEKIPIMISLNGRFLRDSSPDQIVAKISEWIDIMGRDGKFVLGIGNVPADTPPINIHTAVKATRTLGKYPIARDLSAIKVESPQFKPFDEWLKDQPEADIIFKARTK